MCASPCEHRGALRALGRLALHCSVPEEDPSPRTLAQTQVLLGFFFLRYNSHAIKITTSKSVILWFLACSRGLTTITLIQAQLHRRRRNPRPAGSPAPQSLAATSLLSFSLDLLVLGVARAWTHLVRGLQRLTSCTERRVLWGRRGVGVTAFHSFL